MGSNLKKTDFDGVLLGQFVLNTISTFRQAEIDQLVLVYRNDLPANLHQLLDICANRAKLNGKEYKDYWVGDCGELMEKHISFIKNESKKYAAVVDDDSAMSFYLFILFSLSAKASKNPFYQRRIVRRLKRHDKEMKEYLEKISSPEYIRNKIDTYIEEQLNNNRGK